MNKDFYTRTTTKDIDTLMHDLEIAVKAHDFSIVHVHDMGAKYKKLGEETGVVRIVEICNPVKSFKAFSISPMLLSMMPKNIDIYEKDGVLNVQFLYADRERLGRLFPDSPIQTMSGYVAQLLEQLVDEAV